jgi:hypothetical protein
MYQAAQGIAVGLTLANLAMEAQGGQVVLGGPVGLVDRLSYLRLSREN